MRVTEVRYERIRNIGNYENEKLSVVVTLNEDENPKEAVRRAKRFIERHLYGPTETVVEEAKALLASIDESAF